MLDTLILYFEQFVAAVGAAAHSAVLATAVRVRTAVRRALSGRPHTAAGQADGVIRGIGCRSPDDP
ncbi:MAG: hypothetical protein M3P95_00220 [Actinomycetota bacterium]|nr:hypothetical protein [Actinomycetota bacterium]